MSARPPQDWLTKTIFAIDMILVGALFVSLTNSPVVQIRPIGRILVSAYTGMLITFFLILVNIPKEKKTHPKAGKVLVSTVAIKTSSSPPQAGREIARGYAPVENPLKPAGLCENCGKTNCWGLCDAP